MQKNKVIKIVKEMVLAPSTKESEPERPDGADQILLTKFANRSNAQGNHQLKCLCAFFKDCTNTLLD